MNAIFRCLQHKKDFSQKIRIFCRLKFEATSGRLYPQPELAVCICTPLIDFGINPKKSREVIEQN